MFGQSWENLGLGFLLSLLLALWAIYHIAGSKSTPPFFKAVWTLAVLFMPLLGFLFWLLFGPRAKRA